MRDRGRVLLAFNLTCSGRSGEALLDLVQWGGGKASGPCLEELADTAMNARYYAATAHCHLARRRRRGAVAGLTWASLSATSPRAWWAISPELP